MGKLSRMANALGLRDAVVGCCVSRLIFKRCRRVNRRI